MKPRLIAGVIVATHLGALTYLREGVLGVSGGVIFV